MYKICIYYGKEMLLIDRPELPHTCRVVMTLVDRMHIKGHDLYVDRFYNSHLLVVELGKVVITVTGPVQSNRKGLPGSFGSKKKERHGTVMGYCADDMLVFYWVDKREVFVITTKHELSMVDAPPKCALLHIHTIHRLVVRLHYAVYIIYALLFLLWCAQAAKLRLGTRLWIQRCAQVYITIQ